MPACTRRSASTRTRQPSPEAARIDELRELLRHPKVVAVGETGLDTVRGFATAAQQRRLFDAHLGLADELKLPVVIHNREADDEAASVLAAFSGTVVLHCFSSPALVAVAVDRGYYVSFAGNATYPKASHLRDAAAAIPADRILVETDSPYLSPQPVRGTSNEPANVVHTIRALAEARGEEPAELAGRMHANAAVALGWREHRAQKAVSVEPKKALGQHFLVDENILGVIGRMSDLQATDVVLEVGPGLGVLTRYLAERVSLVHSIELDRSLEPVLRDGLDGHSNVRLLWDDALRFDVGELRPPPTKLIANLPYNIATPLVVETLEHATSVERWCVMVQREVADRFFAALDEGYGAVSVLVQLSARNTGFIPSPATSSARSHGSTLRSSRSCVTPRP